MERHVKITFHHAGLACTRARIRGHPAHGGRRCDQIAGRRLSPRGPGLAPGPWRGCRPWPWAGQHMRRSSSACCVQGPPICNVLCLRHANLLSSAAGRKAGLPRGTRMHAPAAVEGGCPVFTSRRAAAVDGRARRGSKNLRTRDGKARAAQQPRVSGVAPRRKRGRGQRGIDAGGGGKERRGGGGVRAAQEPARRRSPLLRSG